MARNRNASATYLWARVDRDPDGCWMWRGYVQSRGYGQLAIDGRLTLVHRFAYELLVGPIPEGLELDHLCHNADKACPGGWTCPHRLCVRPDHLEAVSHVENSRRGRRSGNAKKTECVHGHPFDDANTYWRAGGRACRRCHAIRENQRRQRAAARERS